MKKVLLSLLVLLALAGGAFWFLGFPVARLDPAKPVPRPDDFAEIEPGLSLVGLSLTVTEEDLRILIEGELGEDRYEERDRPIDLPVGEARGDFAVLRDGPLSVRLDDGLIVIELPLAFSSAIRWQGNMLGLRPSFTQEPSGALVATAFLTPRLDGDGTLHLMPSVSVTWKREPKLEILGQTIGIGSVAARFLEGEIAGRTEEIERRLDETLRTRDRLDGLWKDLQEPVQLSSSPSLWLDVRPERLFVKPLDVAEGRLTVKAGLQCRLAVLSSRPSPIVEEPLPSEIAGEPPLEGLDLHVPLMVGYDVLSALAEEGLQGQKIDPGGGASLSVRNPVLSGGGGLLYTALDITGRYRFFRLEGTMHLQGRPLWNREERILTLEDFDYDEKTTEGLARVASWLLQGTFREKLAERLIFPLGEELDRQKVRLARTLERTPLGEGFVLLAELEELAMEDVYAAKDGLVVEAFIRGKAFIVLEDPLGNSLE